MKKVLVGCVVIAASLLCCLQSNAQMKIGTFDEQSVLGLMPGIQKVDTLLQKYVADSLKPEYDYELSELMRLDSSFKKDSAGMQPSTRSIVQKEINQHKYKIVNWQQYQNQQLEQKQEELLYPYKQKIYASLEKIIKEQKYTHVFKSDMLLVAPPQDNLVIKVALDLKLKFPKDVEDQLRAQGLLGSSPASAPAGTTPKPKPANKN
ncbi:OmpH family outer membrane protein [Parasediminibacterium sp. JCM 36343]|uniref:OmpH family outer membrane protein n=1 Tax=Parasediminibacterium sp. JCM 36343 TaxID=3374279 RepID=UPI00397E2026